MATVRGAESSKIMVDVIVGVTETGKDKTSARTISNIKPEVSDDDRRAIGNMYAGLQTYPVSSIRTQETAVLLEA